MIRDQSLNPAFDQPAAPRAALPPRRSLGVASLLRRRVQSAFFPAIDASYPALTHRLRLVYNHSLGRGEPELRYVQFLTDRKRAALDIGAHRGIYAHVLARHAKHVHAFEPHPLLFTYLNRVMPSEVTVHPVALSSAEGTVKFRIPRAGSYLGLGQGTLEELPIFHADAVTEIEVRSSTLDQIIQEPVGFVKIDVEGHELATLEGARALLQRDRPALMIEIADDPALQHYQRVLEFLGGFGYRPYWVDGGALASVTSRGPTDAFFRASGPHGDILCANFIFLA